MELTFEQIKKKYNRFSFWYNIAEWPIEKLWYQRWRKRFLKNIKGKVLEIGIGTGKNLPFYDYTKVQLTAIDISKNMLEQAKVLAQNKKYPVSFKLITSDTLPFENKIFDYIVCTFVLCSVPNQHKTLTEIKRVLKSSGKIIFIEHVLSKNKILAFFQQIHNPISKFLLGVNINRDTINNIKINKLKIINEENIALGDVFKMVEVTK
jgi:ubiquinone/menaquinone biosynthesis C-methylase UbiE